MNKTIKSGTRAVVIYNQKPRSFSARLYVNCTDRNLGDATLVACKFTTPRGAQKWAAKVLA